MEHSLSAKMFQFARKRAFALVAVLGTLSLVTVLILAMISSAATELQSSQSLRHARSARSLSDTALNLTIAQLRSGTQSGGIGSDIKVWASQPGMIRTYSSSGTPDEIFKLYSDEKMVVEASSFEPDLDSIPSDWNTEPYRALYADMNSPVLGVDNKLVYPIVDPALSRGRAAMPGFRIQSAPGYQTGVADSALNNPAPMPVQWLYLLQDGSLVSPQENGATVIVPGATATNPIVGRVAFWADDDSTKVNINTASEGTFWDVPRTYSLEDVGKFSGSFNPTNPSIETPGYAICQPAQKEFQRYPGHPATTSLSAVLSGIFPIPDYSLPYYNSTDAAKFEPYFEIAPRTNLGGSEAGTKVSNNELEIKSDRLYASLDELAFAPDRDEHSSFSSDNINQRHFFLTARSNSPEVTLFNTPRISMWPVHYDPNKRTEFDSLSAFCSSIGGQEYFITRQNARSCTEDLSTRNLELYRYLQALTSKDIPGFSGDFLAKYGVGTSGVSDRDQLLTYVVDYIRCTNLQDRSEGATPFSPLYSSWGGTLGAGEALPLRIGPTQGFGRFYTFSEACLQFYGVEKKTDDNKTTKMRCVFMLEYASPAQGMGAIRKNTKYRVRGLENLVIDFGMGNGWEPLKFKSDGTNFMDNSDLATYHGRDIGGTEGPNQGLAQKSFADSSAGAHERRKYPFFSAEDIEIPDIPDDVEKNFKFSSQGNKITVEVRSADTDVLIQTVELDFPDGEFKIPGVSNTGTENGDGTLFTHNYGGRRFTGTFGNNSMIEPQDTVVGLQVAGAITDPNDPNYTSDTTAGDTRMIESLITVPSERFRPHDDYFNTGVQWAHTLLSATGHPFTGHRFGTLVPVANYNNWRIERNPDLPPCVGTQVTRVDGGPGDWDTGFGDQKDGAHINKPDEGDTALYDSQQGQNRPPYMLGHGQGFAAATKEYFSPNRQIPSSMMIGSLPTGVQRNRPWQTLLFHPRPEDPTHPGKAGPPDHLFADLFWMPVVEPYAISQPFATAGKVNMNYQIQPFTYIKRNTGLRAVMKATKFLAMPVGDVNVYKPLDPANNHTRAPNRRHAINMDATLDKFDEKFASGDLFRSATQICEMDLIPKGHSGTMESFWQANRLTGDNLREKPYVDLYSRLTTKSNTYTVHIFAQSLQKARSTPHGEWVEGHDSVVGEYRGSSVIERYILPGDPDLPDFATLFVNSPDSPDLDIDKYYRFRVVNTKQFLGQK